MYVCSALSCGDRRRAQDAAVAALQVELSCMNKENQHLRGCSRCHAGHHQLPGAPNYRGGLCAAVWGGEKGRCCSNVKRKWG